MVEGQSNYCLSLKEQSECVCLEIRYPECTRLGLVWLPVMDAATGLWLCLGLMSMGNWFDACTRAMPLVSLGWYVACSMVVGLFVLVSIGCLCQGCGWEFWLVFPLPGVWACLYLVGLTEWPVCE